MANEIHKGKKSNQSTSQTKLNQPTNQKKPKPKPEQNLEPGWFSFAIPRRWMTFLVYWISYFHHPDAEILFFGTEYNIWKHQSPLSQQVVLFRNLPFKFFMGS